MTEEARKRIKEYMELGLSRDDAATAVFSYKTLDDFLKAADSGVDFSEQEVRIAQVHTRLDVALLCWEIKMLNKRVDRLSGLLRLACFSVLCCCLAFFIGTVR